MIVIDTHVLIWWVSDSRSKLSSAAREALDDAFDSGGVHVSSISAWEIAMLVRKGKLDLSSSVSTWLDDASEIDGLTFVPVDNAVAVRSLELPGDFHNDPADRIIVATAQSLAFPLVTADEKIRRYPHVTTIW